MKLPNDYKRKYKHKSDTKVERKTMNIMLIVVILIIVAWYAFEILG